MLIQIITISIILILTFYFKMFYLPKKKYQNFITSLQKLGYSVYAHPFSPIVPLGFLILQTDFNKYNDALYTAKHQYNKYDLAVSCLFTSIFIQVINPQLLKQFYSQDKIYLYHKSKSLHGLFIQLLGYGLICSEENSWKKKRKVLNSIFNFDCLIKLIPNIVYQAQENISFIKKNYISTISNKKPIDMRLICMRMTGSVSACMFFGNNITYLREEAIKLGQQLIHLVQQTGNLFSQGPETLIFTHKLVQLGYRKKFRQFKKLRRQYQKSASNIITKTLKQIQNNQIKDEQENSFRSILQYIFQWNLKVEQNQKYTFQDIKAQFSNLHFASTDTTANNILIMLYLLDLYPNVRKNILSEIQLKIKNKKNLQYKQLKQMKYFDCFQQEVIRMYGPANRTLIRQAVSDHKLKDIPISKGMNLMANSYPNHYNEKYFKNPFQFCPERWMEKERDDQLNSFTYLGFAGGPRSCIGKHLALLESKIYLIKFLFQLRLSLINKELKFSATSIYITAKSYSYIYQSKDIEQQQKQNVQNK